MQPYNSIVYTDVAFTIAERYPELCNLKDKSQISALQMLACTPTAFKSGATLGPVKEFLYSGMFSADYVSLCYVLR